MTAIRARIETAVARGAATHTLWPPDATLVVAVSGGADSLCLLGTLLALRESGHPFAPARLVVAHLDHCLRGKAGAEDARFVAACAAEHGLECVVERADVGALARAEHRSIEDAARRVRYAFLRRAARATSAARICTGHTRDDQAETLILHWLRGSGLAGLSGMPPRNGDIARPLLDLTHTDTVAYCAARGWQPREDATNADTTYLRNRVRHELLPLLEHYNPNLRDTLIRNAALIAGDERYLEEQTESAWTACLMRADTSAITLSISALMKLPLALQRRVVRRMATSLLEDASSLTARHIFAVERLISSGASGDSLALPGGLRVRREYAALICERHAPASSSQREAVDRADFPPIPLPIPGVLDLPALGWRLRATRRSGPLDTATLHTQPAPLVDTTTGVRLPAARAYLDADAAGNTLLVRTWRRGDRFQPFGMGSGETKLQDFFTSAKIPRSLRTRLPLVVGVSHLLWVAGLRMDERARVRETTTRVLVLDLETLVS